MLFKETGGGSAPAQIEAFEDTWHWSPPAQAAFEEVALHGTDDTARLLKAMVDALGKNDVTAYLCMMAVRLIELRRVLKPTGSIYLHCDPTASHYLKILMDSIFGPAMFQNEVIWAYRTGGVSKKRWARKHDVLLFYSKGKTFQFTAQQEREYYDKPFFSPQKDADGRYYADVYLRDVWDIPAVINVSSERLGYPTQKPLALLERIVTASSKPGDIVLDPFCGCGTAVHAAQALGRHWLGIDITYLAVGLIERRMRDAFPGIKIKELGTPADLPGATVLAGHDPYQFQFWAVHRLGGAPVSGQNKKGADSGIDGVIPFMEGPTERRRVIISVKGGNIQPAFVRELKGVLEREKEPMGVLVTLKEPTRAMKTEATAAGSYHSNLWNKDYPRIQIITASDILQGRGVDMPPQVSPFTKAQAEAERAKQSTLL